MRGLLQSFIGFDCERICTSWEDRSEYTNVATFDEVEKFFESFGTAGLLEFEV